MDKEGITYTSARTSDHNEVPTSVPMFSDSDNTEKLDRTLYDVWVRWKSNMAAINRELIGNNVNLSSYT